MPFLRSPFSPSAALVGLLVLAQGPRPALSIFDFVTFASAPNQCGAFSIQYSGGTAPTSWPPELTVVPFNSTPFSLPLFDAVFNDTSEDGHAVAFLPLPQGTQFLASLDDGDGNSAGPVSQVITVGASNSTRCLHFENNQTTNPFQLTTADVAQCESFTVNFDPERLDAAPAIRAFIPGKLAFTVNQTASDDAEGTASYLMDATHGTEIALLLANGNLKASSGLFTVGGSADSDATCLTTASASMASNATSTTTATATSATASMSASVYSTDSRSSLSPGAIIAIAASSGAIIVIVVLAMGIWLYRSRKKLRTATLEGGSPSPADAAGEKTPSLPPAVTTPAHASWEFQMQTPWRSKSPSSSGGITNTRNPLYTDPNLRLSSPTPLNAMTGSSKAVSPMYLLGASLPNTALPPSGASFGLRFSEANAARRTPPTASSASIRSHAVSPESSRGHSCSQTQSSRSAPASSPVSPISSLDIEHVLEMTERFTAGVGDGRDTSPLLQPRQSACPSARDSLQTSAYYAAQFPDPDNGSAARKARSRKDSATDSSKVSSVRGRMTPPSLRLPLRVPSMSSLYSLHEDDAHPSRLLTSPTVHVNADGEVIRQPPHAHLPHSPMPSPFPSPL
ncbi:hypothetical protein DAEQUDRAFT_69312 [Daedalea quercina L-15889]|uniref:Uncharacterized protein n=1 Tax=Daedalea quercina L-15889 TaxID=1314783 RepID=A0A165L6E1_9APHY|nr:hypothetical protein DAEQUDRAFT_69312 [Daedalea quercina L-15889]